MAARRELQHPPEDILAEWGPTVALAAVVIAVGAYLYRRRGNSGAESYYVGPVVPGGRVLSPYGERTKQGVKAMHNGIDLEAPRGTPIHAVSGGTVMGVYPDGRAAGYGNTVVLKHKDGEGSLYSHMDTIDPAMHVGATVTPGQIVGTVGCTDSEGGFPCDYSHCHFEIFLPPPGNDRPFTHFSGGYDPNPARADPAAWAFERGIRLV